MKDSTYGEDFENFLEVCPKGKYAKLAKLKLKLFQKNVRVYPLIVNVTPSYVKVTFSSDLFNYKNGMLLPKGTYTLKVTSKGYASQTATIDHGIEGTSMNLSLEKCTHSHCWKSFTSRTIEDESTGIIWQKEGSDSFMNWEEAKQYCKQLEIKELKGFRLPTANELLSLVKKTQNHKEEIAEYVRYEGLLYWSENEELSINIENRETIYSKPSYFRHVKCVR